MGLNAVILELARALVEACWEKDKDRKDRDDEALKVIDKILREHRAGKLTLWLAADKIVDRMQKTNYRDWFQKSLDTIAHRTKAISLPGLPSVFDDGELVRLVCPCEDCGFVLELEGALPTSLTCPCHGERLVVEEEKRKGAKTCERADSEER